VSVTPLLDREQALPETKRERWVSGAGLIVGGILGVAIVNFQIMHPAEDVGVWKLSVDIILALYLAILVHELGHVMVGWAAGFELRGLAVGGLLLERQARGWRLRLTTFSGGFAGMSPRSTEGLTRRYAWLVAGGPAASILLFTAVARLRGEYFGRTLFFVNLLVVISCLIPYTTRGRYSDAKFLMILARKGAAAERLAAILYLIARDAQGTPPRDWPRELLEQIVVPARGTPFLVASLALRYAAALDHDDAEAVAAALEKALEVSNEISPDARRWFLTAASCFQAWFRNRPSQAEEWLASARRVKVSVNQKDWDCRALALIALAKGDAGGARESLTRHLAQVEKRPPCGMLVAERARVLGLLTDLLHQTAQPPPVPVLGRRLCVVIAGLGFAMSVASAQTAPAWKEFSIGPPTRNATRTTRQGISAEGIPFQRAVARAYGIPEYLVLGPNWMERERYAITAMVEDPRDFQPLFQRELAQRFHLQAHRETRDLPVYVLKPVDGVAHKLAATAGSHAGRMSNGDVNLANETISQFASDLAEVLERPIIDETGIAGRFDVSLRWDRAHPESLGSAARDQLGLQMIDTKRGVEVLVVDRVDKLEFAPAAPEKASEAEKSSENDIAGDWLGTVEAAGRDFRLVLHFARNAKGAWLGSVDNLDRPGGLGAPYSSVSFEDSTLKLTQSLNGVVGRYEGKLDRAGAIQGVWKQQGLTTPVTLIRDTSAKTWPVSLSEFSGGWQGDLNLGLAALWLVVHIETGASGLKVTMDSPDQGAGGARATSARIDGAFLTVEWKQLEAVFQGRLSNDHTRIDGLFTQSGSDRSLTLKPVKNGAELVRKRPQTPVKPYPYREERIHYSNSSARIQLGATLTIPPGKGPFPAAILIAGSGPLDRDEDMYGHQTFLVLADYLTRHGVAVLRADKRGIGESKGSFLDALTTDFVSDVEAGLGYLKTRKEVDVHKIGLIGHSEGGVIAPMVAANNSDVAFVVLMAGVGVTGDELAAEQLRTSTEALGVQSPALGDQRASPWLRAFMAIDPADALRKVKCPVLAINGSKDRQVLPGPNLDGIRAALEAAGNRRFDVEELPGLNHLFQSAQEGWPVEYGHIEETIAPEVLDKISSWIMGRAILPAAGY
jgi:uncharacterized protein (TIGR03435 family)